MAVRASPSRSRRSKGTSETDEATVLIRDTIRAFVPAAIAELARLAFEASSETTRVAAINALIDRGYGRLKDLTDGDGAAHGITVHFVTPPPKA